MTDRHHDNSLLTPAASFSTGDDGRFQALITAASDVVYRMNADWTEMRQLSGREFIADTTDPSRSWLEKYIHPVDRPIVLRSIAAAIETRGKFELEHRVLRVDGTIGWTFSRAIPVFDADGAITEWVGMAIDVTARKQAEQALAQQRRLYESILTNTPDLAYVWDLQHRFIYANEGLLKMWGKTWEEAIGRNCLELGYEPWHAAMHGREIDQVAATKLPLRGEVPFTGTFGRRIYDYVLVPVFGIGGDVEAVAGTTRDVTDRKQMEASLVEADRRKDEFLATLAHELRNPLAPIRNAVQLMKLANPQDAILRTSRDIIDRQLQHMIRLVDDLLEVSRITLGQITLHTEQVSLRTVLQDALEAAGPAIKAGGHELTTQLPSGELLIQGDATRLSQVFQNLLDNAAKYTPSGGSISLGTERRGDEVTITVRDSGIGIAAESQPRVFNLFTRVETGTGIKSSGLGIGLAVAKQFVELHGGRIEVNSRGKDLGSEFLVTLPLKTLAASSSALPASVESAVIGNARKVLVVDDNRDAAESLGMLLEMSGWTVTVAFDGAEALRVVESSAPDVVLLDIGMPGMDGYEVARRLRANNTTRTLRLIALTGWGQAQDKQRTADAGFDEHVTKPVEPEALIELLNRSTGSAADRH